jgi:tetraacyldisaccharide-1-P 4'-kinase
MALWDKEEVDFVWTGGFKAHCVLTNQDKLALYGGVEEFGKQYIFPHGIFRHDILDLGKSAMVLMAKWNPTVPVEEYR